MIEIKEFKGITVADYEPLVQIYNTVHPEHPNTASSIHRRDGEWDHEKFVQKRLLAYVDGELAGAGWYRHMMYMHDPHRFNVHLDVLPGFRRQGVGTALYDHIIARLKADHQAQEVHTWAREHHTEGLAFARKRGFSETQRESESWLETADFDYSPYDSLDEKLEQNNIKVKTLSQLCDEVPDALRKMHELEMILLRDLPSPDEITPVPFEQWVKGFQPSNPEFLPEAQYIALYEGEWVGMSALWASEALADRLYQGLTGVRREYRRMGIATALKLRTIQFAQARGNCTIITDNEANNPMLQINLMLGFVKQPDGISMKVAIAELVPVD